MKEPPSFDNMEASQDDDLVQMLDDEEPDFEEIMSCVFQLTDYEIKAYLALRDAPGSTAAELADDLDRARSNAQRPLSTLREKGLAERERRLMDGGGHVYQYTATPLPEVKTMLHESLNVWTDTCHNAIDNFGSV